TNHREKQSAKRKTRAWREELPTQFQTAPMATRLLIHLPAPTAAAVPTTSPRLRKTAAALTASYRRHRPRLAVLAGAAPSGGAVAPAAPAGENRGAGLTPAEAQRLEEFLKADLPHLFDDVGIDRSAYDDRVRFRDPITRYDDIDGYLANIRLLKVIFRPDFYLHDVKQTGPYEITTRWTMVMKFSLLPWKPELVFTGLSIMGVNPQNLKFCSHVDIWDSIQNNEYFSFEGLVEVFKQVIFHQYISFLYADQVFEVELLILHSYDTTRPQI
uniref:Uncharacterized protein n=2 Tax=Aegilops tauschii subsp. strangulata TaxID=200361 RepID=A0A453SAP3_AEGTS